MRNAVPLVRSADAVSLEGPHAEPASVARDDDAMEIKTSLVFPADPETVFGLMTNREFLNEVAQESGASDTTITVDGLSTTSERTLAAPESTQKFTGPTLRVLEERVWSAARPDGGRTATLNLTVPGQPMTMPGTLTISRQGNGTRIDIRGDLKVNIPLVGKKIEKVAAPAIEEGIRAEERVALRWLRP